MQFSVSSTLDYETNGPVTFLLSVRAHAGQGQRLVREKLFLSSGLEHLLQTCGSTGTRFDRLHVPAAGRCRIRYEAVVETSPTVLDPATLPEAGPETFSHGILPYLYPSRYCQSDRLGRLTYDMFGALETPLEKARAVTAWIASRISYVSGSTNSNTSAIDTLVERAGVCRDFAHLGIALCRAMNIPARYFTGYAHQLEPPDFHACFETWIGGRWLIWDATGLASPDGLVRIGTGRDASDSSVCTAFGPLRLKSHKVACRALDPEYRKMDPSAEKRVAVSLEPEPADPATGSS